MPLSHARHGRAVIRPYLFGPTDLPTFLTEVLGATEVERHEMGPESAHVELALDDSIVVVEAGPVPEHVQPTIASTYVYVRDVDAAFERALAAGATEIAKPEDKPYGERQAGFRDAGGNTWWISTLLS